MGAATRSGAEVRRVSGGSAADKAGLRKGDLIVGVDGTNVSSAESLVGLIRAQRSDSTVSLSVIRDGREQTIKAALGTAPSVQS
uniref:PDZ domain-containing protein n=2 Tax=Janibacter limosus TaxID=53458 RepID=A0AC61U8K2_9MICO|nr:PDZ domain-containing protein [Janibacter limosus]